MKDKDEEIERLREENARLKEAEIARLKTEIEELKWEQQENIRNSMHQTCAHITFSCYPFFLN